MTNNPKQSTQIIDQIFKTRKPSEMPVQNLGRQQAKEMLQSKVGPSAESTTDENTPWFSLWRTQFLQSVRFFNHELTQQPVALLFMVTTDDEDPTAKI